MVVIRSDVDDDYNINSTTVSSNGNDDDNNNDIDDDDDDDSNDDDDDNGLGVLGGKVWIMPVLNTCLLWRDPKLWNIDLLRSI